VRAWIVVGIVASAGSARADVQLWTELGARRDVGPRVTLGFDQHLRFDEGVSRVSAVMPEAGLDVRFARWLRGAAAYRFEYERDGDGELVVRHRWDAALRGVMKLGRLRGEYEQRFEEELRPSSQRKRHVHVLRERASVAWQQAHWQPEVSVTVFQVLGRDETVDKMWFTAGVTRRRHGRAAEVFYRLAVPYERMDRVAHIFGITLRTDL